jgi:hypothetical protein
MTLREKALAAWEQCQAEQNEQRRQRAIESRRTSSEWFLGVLADKLGLQIDAPTGYLWQGEYLGDTRPYVELDGFRLAHWGVYPVLLLPCACGQWVDRGLITGLSGLGYQLQSETDDPTECTTCCRRHDPGFDARRAPSPEEQIASAIGEIVARSLPAPEYEP